MPRLVTKISAELLSNYTSNVYFFSSISGEIGFEDYIKINGFTAYLQNFKQAYYVENLTKPLSFGLQNQYNLPTITLNISY